MSASDEERNSRPEPDGPAASALPAPHIPDLAAAKRLQAILSSPSYRKADEDIHFLTSAEARGPRLELEYLKAELLLRRHGVTDTIVVFGSTRIVEPALAESRLAESQARATANPNDAALARQLAAAKRARENSRYYQIAREFGGLVGAARESGDQPRLAIVTGGGPGIMEAANRGAFEAGAETVGLNITLPHEQLPNSYVTPSLCLRFRYFALRKMHFMLRARALVAFPGGFGTFDELFETLTLVQTGKVKPIPIILVGESYWRRAFDVDFLVDEGVIAPRDRDIFRYAETAPDIWEEIRRWGERKADLLFE
ncbi:TIGR00730 family Rossman fold protein [Methylocystis sp. H62]|uniref:LOG family protein n=1 Tax=Methylocystis sp. H62 TaxID=2785789 RepID=UPI0018C21F7A|nr:TIGR00730 family Rossman fold protein [Methylocystis sp. H62]MBG0793373.1 TIGR00730 family Rossman fold protein [Methylocystis sp. H62]